jgi:pyrroline-5-carboxylate reductase
MNLTEVNTRGMVLLGCGKMGSAMLQGWIEQGVQPGSVWVNDPNPSDWLKAAGVHLNATLPSDPAVVLIAVKPQMMIDALPSLTALGNGATLFISVAAGISIAYYEGVLGAQTPIIRAMPNTPAAVSRGITAMCKNPHVTDDHSAVAQALLGAVGQVVQLEGEHQMDAVTGVSGSGPAYVFHMIEAMAQAGEAAGLAPDLAMTLARATVCGAGELAYQSPESAAQLRINVTSPAGTTAAGLEVLMADLPDLMTRTVAAAANRSKELGQ